MAITDQEKLDIKNDVLDAIKSESQSVDELPVVDSLDGITSLPAMRGEELVSAPITLLSKPATDAAAVANTSAKNADTATANSNTATKDAFACHRWRKITVNVDVGSTKYGVVFSAPSLMALSGSNQLSGGYDLPFAISVIRADGTTFTQPSKFITSQYDSNSFENINTFGFTGTSGTEETSGQHGKTAAPDRGKYCPSV